MKEMPRNYMIFNDMTGNISENPLQDSESDEELANNFADFFIHKIPKMRDSLEHHPKYDPRKSTTRPKEVLSQFSKVSEDEVQKIINRMATKSCVSDPIPTSLLKQILPAVISTITKIMNVSLRERIFAPNCKTAIVKPLLKNYSNWCSVISGLCQTCPFGIGP